MKASRSVQSFLSENFLLASETARRLYFDSVAELPIIDYHTHLPVAQIASDYRFDTITDAWLRGDHYKWRAMRACGIDESYCSGSASDWEKFLKWAETVPQTVLNPLFHWTHLELKRYFGIEELLNTSSARSVYEACNERLRIPDSSTKGLLRGMNVEVVCTTDDPVDSLEHHACLASDGFEIGVFPTFRPDGLMKFFDADGFCRYARRLSECSGIEVRSAESLLEALLERHDAFHETGCRASDEDVAHFDVSSYTRTDIEGIVHRLLNRIFPTPAEMAVFRAWLRYEIALMSHEKGWAQQYHVGALRNLNTRMFSRIGADAGFDSMGDRSHGEGMAHFLDRLDVDDRLARTILYNMNPADNELFATMAGNFNTGDIPGKIQWGAAWWYMDQKDGIERHLGVLSSVGLLSRFVGMLTDSRSFLSFPRHEYFRRILCNFVGDRVERGELPNDTTWLGDVVADVCYRNAKSYFRL